MADEVEYRVKALEGFIESLVGDHVKASVETFCGEWTPKRPFEIRISEVSLWYDATRSGVTWFRTDPDACSVILQAEQYVLWYDEPEEREDAEWALRQLIAPKDDVWRVVFVPGSIEDSGSAAAVAETEVRARDKHSARRKVADAWGDVEIVEVEVVE